MTLVGTAPEPQEVALEPRPRHAWADNLKATLVAGVIVGHATIAWTGVGNWAVFEPPVREPLLTVLVMLTLLGAMFAMPLFFLIAGLFTPASLERKGLHRFLVDRLLRLGTPLVFFVVFLAPIIEYVDADNAGWDKGFLAFAPTVWWPWPPAWGPTWFLAALLAFSIAYAVVRSVRPRRTAATIALSGWQLIIVGAAVALASYLVRFAVPLGDELHRLALGQAPAWIAGFVLGVVGAERRWYDSIQPRLERRLRHLAWSTVAAIVITVAAASAAGADINAFGGGGTWQSLLTAALEGALVVTMPLWLMDTFRRRWDHQGRLARASSHAAFAAFVLHQIVLIGFVLASRSVPWPPEVEYVTVSALAVVGSFALGALAVRMPGVSRIV